MFRKVSLGLFIVIAVSSLALAQHAKTCNTLTTTGTYAVKCSGELMTPNGPIPFEAFAEAVIDYSGYVKVGKSCNNIGGQVTYGPLEGQSIVFPDCTTDVRYYPLGYKQIPFLDKNDWIFYIRANIVDDGDEMQGFILAMQDPNNDFALMPVTPAVQCTLTRKSRSLSEVTYNPNWCTVPAVQ